MEKVTDIKVEIKVNGKNALSKDEEIFYENADDGGVIIKTKLGDKTKQDLEMRFTPFTDFEETED